MNAAFLGEADLGPRAHPGDGLLDVTDGRVDRREVGAALARARTGTHVPHPGLAERRVDRIEADTDGRPWHLVLDGVAVGRTRRFRVTCLPDALVVVA
jgi:diacylglycerol kinase family enzyme